MNSYWIESTKNLEKEHPSLDCNLEVDVLIIGAGLVGISSAYYLLNSGLKTVILERDKVCSKVSGHSTAKITSQHNLFYDYLINSFNKQYAKDYLNANEEAKTRIKEIIEKENIDCDFSMQDSYVYAYSEAEVPSIETEVKAVNSLGFPCEFVKDLPLPIKSHGAIKFPNQAQFNPRKFALKLADILTKNKIDIYENTIVTKVEKDKDGNYEVYTTNAKVTAKYVILATHYPIVNFPRILLFKNVSKYVICNCRRYKL